ncbi:MAG: T9SS type A sorting domain-containing protein [Bacteroidia bacterium]
MQKSTFIKSLYFMLILLMPYGINAQVQFGIRVMPDTKTYELVMKPSVNWNFPYNLTSTAQVTFKVPHSDVAGESFTVDNLSSKIAGTSWIVNGRLNDNIDAAGYDVISIGLNSLGVPLPFASDQEEVLFSFENNGACLGAVEILSNTDPIMTSAEHNLSLTNQINTFGSLDADAYSGPYNAGATNCGDYLPVELLSFTAQAEGEQVRLDWTTSYELNNDYFTIERSYNGQSYSPLAEVDGAGNSQTPTHYQAYDERPIITKLYYRLKQTDFDGTFSYSEVVEVALNPNELNLSITAFPNPIASGSKLNLSLEAPRSATVIIEIADQHGRKIYSRPSDLNVGSNQIELTETDWAAGIYFLRVYDETLSQSKKIIVH